MIHIILGTKAQLIKMAPIMVKMNERNIFYNFIFTGQHRETMGEMLEEFNLKPPDITLYSGKDIVSIPQMFIWVIRILCKSLFSRKKVFGNDRNGIVLVHGDTFSTFLGGLMGRIGRLKVGHVESGLRSFNLFHPFPEEITRLLTFKISHYLFCPGEWAVNNVKTFKKTTINTNGNTMIDSLAMALKQSGNKDHIPDKPFAIVTIHRYENIFKKDTLDKIINIIQDTSKSHYLLFILHPPTLKKLKKYKYYDLLEANINISLRPRYTYFDFVTLLSRAEFIITDGGSNQEESSYLGVPCLLMRKATERKEGLGDNVVLSDYNNNLITDFIKNHKSYRKEPLLGKISPSSIIIDHILEYA